MKPLLKTLIFAFILTSASSAKAAYSDDTLRQWLEFNVRYTGHLKELTTAMQGWTLEQHAYLDGEYVKIGASARDAFGWLEMAKFFPFGPTKDYYFAKAADEILNMETMLIELTDWVAANRP